MSTVGNIYDYIDRWAPFSSQMSFDNSGLLVGSRGQEVRKVLITLDITETTAQEAADLGCELIISHHPIIFHPLKSLTEDEPTGKVLRMLVRNEISAVCAHTNLDVAEGGVNDCLAEALGLKDTEILAEEGRYSDGKSYGCGRAGNRTSGPVPLEDFLNEVKDALKPNGIRYVDSGKPVCRVAVGGGACMDYLPDVIAKSCDTFVTSDVKYNGFLDAIDFGINLIDAGHFPTENIVCPELKARLAAAFPGIEFILSERHHEGFRYL